ncbi:G-protein coupled receptor 143-like isoform X1 [Hemicordylus capensis]|uniref:G-protein coupled receptor 143-like isoform X1 n=1 Tax=Hemicordylus capensis TaxID=884348 RepID=UPI0023040778|nr:G-protein coupled receptor 143-like isoform X1 [Hemicordylus capensis]XP_053129330.1 G-protein coupled receptor 143-like isoform X1 [Hemicordylus capensis]
MASPWAQRFCEAAPSKAATSTAAAAAATLPAFEAGLWHGLCLGSATLSLLGVALLKALRSHRHRRGSCRASDGRLGTASALRRAALSSGCLGTAGILLRSLLWLAPPSGLVCPLCILTLIWVQYCFVSHFWALFCYSLEAFLLLRDPTGHRSLTLYYLLCWGVSTIQFLPGLQLLMAPPDARCSSHQPLAEVLAVAHCAASYVPLTLVLLGSPVLFSRALAAVPALLQRDVGRYTASERRQQQQLRRRFLCIMATFVACWMANVVNEVLLLLERESLWRLETRHLLHDAALACWAMMAILNPLSGFLLMLVFSVRRRDSFVRRRRPTWGASGDTLEDSARNCDLLSEATRDPAFGFLVSPGMLEVSSLLASLDTSTSMDDFYSVAENSPVQPLCQDVQVSQEEGSSAEGCCKEGLLGWSCRG